MEDLLANGGIGGVIALDDQGNGVCLMCAWYLTRLTSCAVAMPLNCPGMYRGLIREDGVPKTAIFNDDVLD